MKRILYSSVLIITLFLSYSAMADAFKYNSYEDRAAVLAKIQSWSLSAAVSVKQNNNTTIASVNWRQQGPSNYQILLSGPLSMGTIKITGEPNKVTLWKSSKQHYEATSPEELMEQQIGWQIPITNLYYWIRGIAAPGPFTGREDKEHRVIYIEQQGWKIIYPEYIRVGKIDFPHKMILSYPNLGVKIVIKRWHF